MPNSLEINVSSSVQNSREQRLANFITLKNLENQIPKELFEQIVAQINDQGNLPQRTTFEGAFSRQIKLEKICQKPNKRNSPEKLIGGDNQELYKRMKTVFGHSIIQDGCGTPVYNCKFDKLDRLIITGADDGIIKIWRKDTMVLQASLHGHMDVIIDIQVSHCNRYFASGSKEGTIIIWDLEKCCIIKRQASDHTAQVNSLKFIMIPCSKTQVNKNSSSRKDSNISKIEQQAYVEMYQNFEYQESGTPRNDETEAQYDQYLVSCSDDGSINVYDCSSFKKSCNDEFYTTNLTDKTKIYKPHSKAIKQFSVSTMLMQSLSLESKEPLAATVEEQNDKVTRRTRKRHFQAATQPGGITNHNTASSSSQSPNCSQDSEINMFKLRPEDFRIGSKNKHIDAFSVNSKGFVIGATNAGEIYLWKMNFSNMRQRKNDNYSLWINSFKLHKKAIHYVEFNQSGNILMTGSADGTSCLWDMNCLGDKTQKIKVFGGEDQKGAEEAINKEQKFKYKNIEISEDKTLIHKFYPKSDLFESQIDHIEWSKNGRYAFCAMSIKPCKKPEEEEEQKQDQLNQKQAIVQIKVYDTFSGQIIDNLDKACRLGKEIKNYACVMKSHPFKQNILLACFDGGISILYDIQSMQIIQEIIEYGIYSIDQFTMNNAVDVDFSQDGDYIAFSSIYGTLSLYSTQHHKQIQYQYTRVQQFFSYDDRMHDKNLYEELTDQPQLMGFELNPYEVQPSDPIVGKFKNQNELTEEEFHRSQVFGKEFAVEEEIFYQDQLQSGIRRGLFDPDSPEMRNLAAQAQQRELLESGVALVSFNAVEVMNEEMHGESDDEILQPRRRTSVVRQNNNQRRRRLARTDELPEDINDSQRDEGGDDSFEDSKSNSNLDESEEDEDNFSVMQSEYMNGHRVGAGLHSQARNERDYITNEDINRHRSQRRQVVDDASQSQSQGRNLRSRRPAVQDQSQSQSQSQNMNLRRRRRVVARSSDGSVQDDRSDDQSNFGRRQGGNQNGRRPQRNRQLGRNQEILSSDNELMDDGESDSLDGETGRRRSGRNNNRTITRRPAEQQNGGRRSRGRRPIAAENNRPRANRRGQDIEDESMIDDLLETDQDKTLDIETVDQILGDETNDKEKIELDQKLEFLISQNNFKDIKDSDTYSQRGSKSKHGAVIIKEGNLKEPEQNQTDCIFILKDKATIIEKSCAVCYFCKRQIDEDNLVGPFVRSGQAQEILESQDEDQIQSQSGQYFFHDRCLSVNKYVKYDKTKQKWVNIANAIKNLVDEKSYTCYRCLLPGATSQCVSCDRKFHGHYCNKLYMLATDYEDQNHICIFCRNQENQKSYKHNGPLAKELTIFHKETLAVQRKDIEKSHTMETRAFSQNNFFVPQIGDEVVYFFQGHEKFHQNNNCFFFCGDNEKMSSKDLPWMRNNFIKNIPHGQLVCKVLDISHKFPSIKASNLMTMYGEFSSEISQVAQIITYVYLQVQDENEKNQIKFTAQIFKSEANQYLVHKDVYDAKFKLYQKACANNTLQGKRFKTTRGKLLFNGHDVQVQDITPVEPDYMPKSHWESICVLEIENQQRGRRTAGSSTETDRINFWEIIYPEESKIPLYCYLPTAFDEMENERLIDVAQIFIQKKTDICEAFLNRVEESVANDYKSWIPYEMWLQLILTRLTNHYYRSLDQLWYDLESITQCSVIYNGEDDELTEKAQSMVEKLRKDMRYHITDSVTKINKKFIHDVDAPVLGFSNQNIIKDSDSIEQPIIKPAPLSKEKKFDTSIGQGGINIKNHLKDNLDFESPENSNRIQISLDAAESQKRKVGRPRKIKRTVDDQGNQLISQDQNSTNEFQNLSQSRGNSFNGNTEALFNGPKITIGQRKTRRQLKISGEDAEEDQVILAKVDNEYQTPEKGSGANNDADVIVGVKRNHQQASVSTSQKPTGIITIHTGPGPEEATGGENQNSGKIQIPMGDIRRSTRNKRQKIDM